jgi:homoaconitate hydratase
MGATVVEKIARAHMVEGPSRPLRPGDMVMLRPRHLLTHDNTAAVMTKFRAIGAAAIHDARQPVIALDHEIQNRSDSNLEKYERIRAFAEEHGLDFHPAGTGIGHQIMMEAATPQPGALVVASDSHANMYGAVGALGTPVVRTDAASIWATGRFWWQVPRTVQVVLEGAPAPGVSGKDVILTLCALYRSGEVLNAAVEFAGPGVASLDMDARMSIANMTTEWGALTGWFPVDDVTLGVPARAVGSGRCGNRSDRCGGPAGMEAAPPALTPMPTTPPASRWTCRGDAVRGGTGRGPGGACRRRWRGRPGIAIDRAYLLSCVNGGCRTWSRRRRCCAGDGRGRRDGCTWRRRVRRVPGRRRGAAPGRRCWRPARRRCRRAAVRASAWARDCSRRARSGSRPRTGTSRAGWAPGPPASTWASPRTVAVGSGRPHHRRDALPLPLAPSGCPARRRATSHSRPRRWTTSWTSCRASPQGSGPAGLRAAGEPQHRRHLREGPHVPGAVPGEMAAVVMQNYDPRFASTWYGRATSWWARATSARGPSREQAATALQAAGIALVIAESFSQTYLRNAFNNGFICIECPPLVRAVEAALGGRRGGTPTLVPGDDWTSISRAAS